MSEWKESFHVIRVETDDEIGIGCGVQVEVNQLRHDMSALQDAHNRLRVRFPDETRHILSSHIHIPDLE